MKAYKINTLIAKRIASVLRNGLLFGMILIFVGCGAQEKQEEEKFSITGTWQLNELLFLSGQSVDVHTGYEYVWYRFFEDNGTYYVAELNIDDKRKPVKPHEISEYFFMMSPYDTVYIEHGRMTDLNIFDINTIGIDRGDYVEVYVKNDGFSDKRVTEVERIVESALQPEHNRKTQYIVPMSSTPDNSYRWMWTVALSLLVCMSFLYILYHVNVRNMRSKDGQDSKIFTEENQSEENMSEQIFTHSDYYLALRQHLCKGPALKQDEWEELEAQMRSDCPRFFRRLAEMGQLSEVELRVCMLTKLGVPPSAIAIHTFREYSSISTIRSRLYFKLFGKKGSAKELDEFVRKL